MYHAKPTALRVKAHPLDDYITLVLLYWLHLKAPLIVHISDDPYQQQ